MKAAGESKRNGKHQIMCKSFVPGPETTRDFRDALGCFATGVTIITAQTETGPIGMTANSFSALSLTPPLVLWSPSKTSRRYPFFAAAKHFAIHVVRADQKELAMDFAKEGDCFDKVAWAPNNTGVPVLSDCLCAFECTLEAEHDAGDHAILVGRVENATIHTGRPLVFAKGSYGGFDAAP